MEILDGKGLRDQALAKIQKEHKGKAKTKHLAIFMVGNDPVCQKYVDLKQKLGERCGLLISVYSFDERDQEDDILECIKFINNDPEVDGVMIQIPISKKFDQTKLISALDPKKDVDGLRYCSELASDFVPPVVLAIEEALSEAKVDFKSSKIMVVGKGFLVGAPLARRLKEAGAEVVATNKLDANSLEKLKEAEVVISAVGKAGLIQPDMIKEDVVLIDAGTTESNGELKGDIDPGCYMKSSFYTPVPGGIGPLTISMLFQNLVK